MPYYYGERPGVRFGGGGMPPVVKQLIMINVAVFMFQLILGSAEPQFKRWLGLVPALVSHKFTIWQFFTYMFLHGSIGHIFINMFVLWMFGSELEREWGSKSFLRYYFITGIGAGFIYYLSAFNSPAPTIGASGAIFGLLVAFGMMFPNRIVLVSLIFPMKAKHAVILFAGIELYSYLQHGTAEGIARFAHLGGMLIGYLYLKHNQGGRFGGIPLLGDIVFRFSQWIIRQRAKKQESTGREPTVDEILDKISRQGMESLTEKEKKILGRRSGY